MKRIALTTVVLLGAGGCTLTPAPKPIEADAFYAPQATGATQDAPRKEHSPTVPRSVNPDVAIADVVRDQVKEVPTGSAIMPPPSSQGSGQYLALGGVMTIVDNSPIYAHRVLARCEKELALKARSLDESQYRKLARELIQKNTSELARSELEFAAAVKNLDADDRRVADLMTTMWRTRRIAEAGGSIELARRKDAAEGLDFDTQVEEKYRLYMTQLFYQKKVFPRIQISADDLRRFYAANKKNMFTQLAEARFRIIKVSQKNTGSKEDTIKKITMVHDQAKAGEDFAKLAGSINDEPAWMRNSGDLGWMQKGAFKLEKVEQAVWKLQPGEVSDIIEIDGDYYIAKLEDRKLGREQPFESEEVQKRCQKELQDDQFRDFRSRIMARLESEAVMNPNPPEIGIAMEMAMQKYVLWRK